MKTKICVYCGEVLKKSWDSCPNCGTTISDSSPQELPKINPFKVPLEVSKKQVNAENLRENGQPNILGYLAIAFGILGLVFGYGLGVYLGQFAGIILEIAFAILAMISGGIPLYKREINRAALAGLILGLANIVLFFYFMPFFWYRF